MTKIWMKSIAKCWYIMCPNNIVLNYYIVMDEIWLKNHSVVLAPLQIYYAQIFVNKGWEIILHLQQIRRRLTNSSEQGK